MITLGDTRENEEQGRVGKSIEEYLRSQESGATEALVDKDTNSNFVGCSIGRSTGFVPLRILST